MSTIELRRARAAAHDLAKVQHLEARATAGRAPRPAAELKRIAGLAAVELQHASTDEVTAWAAREFGDLLAVACSMADAVLPHVVATHAPWVDVLFLDTGYHFSETVGTREAVETTMQVNVVDVRPRLTVVEQDSEYGKNLFERDPTACCAMRKVEPLAATLGGYEAWVTGVRRDEAPTRANTPLVDWDETNGLVKINPLAAWSFDDLLRYASEHDVIINPLVDDGYPSIGCAPCTKRVAPGEDPRSGRWAGLEKIECGLHG